MWMIIPTLALGLTLTGTVCDSVLTASVKHDEQVRRIPAEHSNYNKQLPGKLLQRFWFNGSLRFRAHLFL